MSQFYIRVWQEMDVEDLKRHLIIVGDLTADCAACRHLGIEYQGTRQCPGCGTLFNYITARTGGASGVTGKARGAAVKRIKDRCPDLVFVDYEDYKEITGKQQARDFFGS